MNSVLEGIQIYEHKVIWTPDRWQCFVDDEQYLPPENHLVLLFETEDYGVFDHVQCHGRNVFLVYYDDRRFEIVCQGHDHKNAVLNEFAFRIGELIAFVLL
jgi:hypothetical protein